MVKVTVTSISLEPFFTRLITKEPTFSRKLYSAVSNPIYTATSIKKEKDRGNIILDEMAEFHYDIVKYSCTK